MCGGSGGDTLCDADVVVHADERRRCGATHEVDIGAVKSRMVTMKASTTKATPKKNAHLDHSR